jgi:hypothetical protein
MSDRFGIILVKPTYLNTFKEQYLKYKFGCNYGLVSLSYFGDSELKANTILTEFSIRDDDKGRRLTSIINGSPKLFDSDIFDLCDPYKYSVDRRDNLAKLKEKTIVKLLNDWAEEYEPDIDKHPVIKQFYEQLVSTLDTLKSHNDYFIIIGIR